ncbi:hypothetical protein BDQ12DRAFT_370296 [Crucibulum laeve]|uniref:Uncharacterized protein n=1 Tax=Crucibulum laeve TaxID=68775 RepID=A0A5C3LNL4_9AGAR|nr:hypothetical protein BDQ12DRAFT_370296 [Crucibulum laeve]
MVAIDGSFRGCTAFLFTSLYNHRSAVRTRRGEWVLIRCPADSMFPSLSIGWPDMHFYSRAGLVALTLALFITLSTAVPVPSSQSIQARSANDGLLPLVTRTDASIASGQMAFKSRVNTQVAHDLTTNDKRIHAQATLVRRKSIFTKIKNGFKVRSLANDRIIPIDRFNKKIGKGIKKAAQKIGGGIKKAAKKVASGVKTAAKKVASGVKKVAKKVGSGVKTAVKKVGKFVKTTGAKIAKVGLKLVSAVQSVAAKAANFIPGIGKPISKAIKAVSAGTNAASNAIHVKLGKKLDKVVSVADKVRNPVGEHHSVT